MAVNLLITGAGRGLGLEIAAEALERGHRVFAGMRNPEKKNAKLSELTARYSDKLICVRLDVTDEDGIADLAADMRRSGLTLGTIVNNAAVLEARNTPIEQLDMEAVARSFDINLFGPMRAAKHLLPLLTEKSASFINISSEAGSLTNAYPGDYPYGITKAALNMLTEQLRRYLKDRGVAVYSVHPGWMKTDMGGEKAPTDPRKSAIGIMDLIERKVVPDTPFHFVDYTGNAMPI
nr:SDR family oxidoreductase [Cohnella lubricantis]